MNTTQTIATRSGVPLSVELRAEGAEMAVSLQAPAARCLVHWGVRRQSSQGWEAPPRALWPPGSVPAGQSAVQSPLSRKNGNTTLVIRLNPSAGYAFLDFVLFFPEEGRWDNNNGRNYRIPLAPAGPPAKPPLDVLRAAMAGKEILFERALDIEGQWQLAAVVTTEGERYRVDLLSNIPGDLRLHWGIARRSPHEWLLPPESLRGPGTLVWQGHTAQTPFTQSDGFNGLHLEFAEREAPLGIQFVLKQEQEGRWLKHRGGNFYVPIHTGMPEAASLAGTPFADLADEIIRAETTHNSWTLMHRFNLCFDLLDRVRNSLDGQALLFVWLRFSAIRQLTWQRSYNTKPRELAHAQNRLTGKLAEIYRAEPAPRPIMRLALSTVGPGGEGQRIRDEILNIMHRHRVKEVSGHFLEEWHQKLHNNTTPDDVVICEAYLEFLRSDGNLDRFYKTLQAGGVTRQRLESFERPIRSHPQFVGDLKEGLLHDFGHFLAILKASHSGIDFETARFAAAGQLDAGLQGLLSSLWEHRNDPGLALGQWIGQVTEARRRLSDLLHQSATVRELLYLDLSLEQLIRAMVERNIHLRLDGDQLADIVACVLENVTLSYEDPELAACSRHWERLQTLPRFQQDWALRAKSVAERIGRALSAWIDRFYHLLQPKAQYLGRGFQAEAWTVTLFSEEVVRGSSLGFALSMLLRHLDPLLRRSARLGDWQVISRGRGAGQILVVESLREVQGRQFDGPRVIVADKVMGDEEIPDGVTAVISKDTTDVVSHVAVRARNANLLFVSCYDAATLERLKSLQGRTVHLEVNPAGDVVVRQTEEAGPAPTRHGLRTQPAIRPRPFTAFAVTAAQFNDRVVGSKALHLAGLRDHVPDWIHLPVSVAVPFGVCEKVLSLGPNQAAARRCRELVAQAEGGNTEALTGLRQTVAGLELPAEMLTALRQAMAGAGLAWPDDTEKACARIKQVWASKWNDRAFLSRKAMGIPHENLVMSVLIQQVVPADYAFVIHTVNPATDNPNELFTEVVLGLGETLVGNHPGRALSFVWDKTAGTASLRSYPSKSLALHGAGLIFRSDSNGEDLPGYAGAGLYESVALDPLRSALLDYTQEPLVWDEGFRENLLATIARVGLEIERLCQAPQDIEGVVSEGNYYVVQTRPQVGLEVVSSHPKT